MATDTSDDKITLYWLDYSRAQRIVWLLEETNRPYEIEKYNRVNGMAPEEGKKIHPLGKFPMIKVNDRVLAETGFMTEFLVDRYAPHLKPDPSDEDETLRYKYFLHYTEGSLMPPLVFHVILTMMLKQSPFFIKPILNMIVSKVQESFLFPQHKLHMDFLEGELKDRTFLCSEKLTGADIVLSYALVIGKGRIHGYNKSAYPRLWAYIERLEALEGYKRSMEKTKDMDGPNPPSY